METVSTHSARELRDEMSHAGGRLAVSLKARCGAWDPFGNPANPRIIKE
jgi:hypothetical protein